MPNLRNYHVFISHSWKYSEDYQTVVKWLDNAPNFLWSDYSVPFDDPLYAKSDKELKEEIESQIAKCSCVVIISGMYVAYSKWIDFEIDAAVSSEKPIIGLRPRGQEKVPTKVTENATVMVNWSSSSLVEAIREYSL